jgi:hypothetical protein
MRLHKCCNRIVFCPNETLKHLWKNALGGKINLGIIAYFREKHLGIIAN